MNAFVEKYFSSRVTVVLVLFLVFLIQSQISYSLSIGKLANLSVATDWLMGIWAVVRMLSLAFVVITLFLDRKDALFKGIIFTNALYTVGLLANIYALSTILTGMTQSTAGGLLPRLLAAGGGEHAHLLDLVLDHGSARHWRGSACG